MHILPLVGRATRAKPERGGGREASFFRHCEERSDAAIHLWRCVIGCFASLAMTKQRLVDPHP